MENAGLVQLQASNNTVRRRPNVFLHLGINLELRTIQHQNTPQSKKVLKDQWPKKKSISWRGTFCYYVLSLDNLIKTKYICLLFFFLFVFVFLLEQGSPVRIFSREIPIWNSSFKKTHFQNCLKDMQEVKSVPKPLLDILVLSAIGWAKPSETD